ncbi:MAG: hypothetical protein ACI865_000120 [Flavobacteriaceae bacterium]|jgi:hypothetical protein
MMKAFSLFILLFTTVTCLGQKDRYFIFLDAETGMELTDVTLTAINSSKPIFTYNDGVVSLKKHKKKFQYYVTGDEFEARSIAIYEVPKKKDTTRLFVLPSESLMDKRWEAYSSDSTLGITNETVNIKNARALEVWVTDQVIISRAAMIHCEILCARGSTFFFRMAFEVGDDGLLYNPTVDYAKDGVKCKYMLREMKRILWEMPNIRLEDELDGRTDNKQRLILPITIGL